MSYASFIKICIYKIFQIEDDLATYVGAGSKVKDMTAVNTVSIVLSVIYYLCGNFFFRFNQYFKHTDTRGVLTQKPFKR